MGLFGISFRNKQTATITTIKAPHSTFANDQSSTQYVQHHTSKAVLPWTFSDCGPTGSSRSEDDPMGLIRTGWPRSRNRWSQIPAELPLHGIRSLHASLGTGPSPAYLPRRATGLHGLVWSHAHSSCAVPKTTLEHAPPWCDRRYLCHIECLMSARLGTACFLFRKRTHIRIAMRLNRPNHIRLTR